MVSCQCLINRVGPLLIFNSSVLILFFIRCKNNIQNANQGLYSLVVTEASDKISLASIAEHTEGGKRYQWKQSSLLRNKT